MSHQSGITAGPELEAMLGDAVSSDSVRMIKVQINFEAEPPQLVSTAVRSAEGEWRDDYDKCILDVVDAGECCYVVYRLDTKNSNGFDWIFISYSHDNSLVREKMLYASTRSTFKTLFGTQYIKSEMFGTIPEDVSLEGYDAHITSENAPAPKTMEELEKEEIAASEVRVDIGASTKRSCNATGVNFPVSEEGLAQIQSFKDGEINFVQLELDIDGEMVNLTQAGVKTIDEAGACVPADQARYQLYRFKHNHEGEDLNTVLFVYSCPAFALKVKERMLYASCKAPLLDVIEGDLGIVVEKKLEIENGTEFTFEEFNLSLHPIAQVHGLKFARPKGPGGRKGSKSRLTSRANRK